MPLWRIYHPEGTFVSPSARASLARDITRMYTERSGMPAFYVIVTFIPLPSSDIFVGGEARGSDRSFLRIVVSQIHIRMPDNDAHYASWLSTIDAVLKPHIADHGWDWEYHIEETDRRLWKINGIAPPEWKSDEEKEWVKANRPLPRR